MNNKIFRKISSILSIVIIVCLTLVPNIVYAKNVELNSFTKSVNEPFEVSNFLPGDSCEKVFNVNLKHKGLAMLCFSTEITQDDKNLANILNIKIEITNKSELLYDGPMSNMPQKLSFKVQPKEQENVYKITISLDTSVGNEYQFSKLIANFKWWYEPYTEPTTEPTTQPTTDSDIEVGGNGDNNATDNDNKLPWLDFSPSTGLMFNMAVLIVAVGIVILFIFIIILMRKRKNKNEGQEH